MPSDILPVVSDDKRPKPRSTRKRPPGWVEPDPGSYHQCVCCRVSLRYRDRGGVPGNERSITPYIYCRSCWASAGLATKHTGVNGKQAAQWLARSWKVHDRSCHYTGEPLGWIAGLSPDHITPITTISGTPSWRMRKADRVPWDPSNIMPCSANTNKLKGALPSDDFFSLIRGIRSGWLVNTPSQGTISILARILNNCRSTSKCRGHQPPAIDEGWILDQIDRQNGLCHWSGLTLPDYQIDRGLIGKKVPKTILRYTFDISIDRMDESIGYYPEGCVICLAPFNMARSGGRRLGDGSPNPRTLSPKDMLIWIDGIRTGHWDYDWLREVRGWSEEEPFALI